MAGQALVLIFAAEAAGADRPERADIAGVDPGKHLLGPPVEKRGGQGGTDGGFSVAVAPELRLADDIHDLIGAGEERGFSFTNPMAEPSFWQQTIKKRPHRLN